MRRFVILALLLRAAGAHAQGEFLSCDFEQGADLKAYPALSATGGASAEVVTPGFGGKGACLLISNAIPGRYATLTVNLPLKLVKNLTLSFDCRAEVEEGKQGAYVGILFTDLDKKQYFGSTPFRPEWGHAEIPVASLHPTHGTVLTADMEFSQFTIYGRAKGEQTARMKLYIDNLRVAARPREGRLSEKTRTSNSNPPLFNWLRSSGKQTLAYSRDPGFPDAATTKVDSGRNWFLPQAPFEPGTYYWRVWTSDALSEGWSDTERVIVPAEAHRFRVPPVPAAKLAERPHPRLVTAEERAAVTPAEIPNLVKQAEGIYRQGIADECPIWQEGDPRWPTWIDWYGKAAGGITSRAGVRVEQLSRLYMLTRDPKIRDWLKEMALKAASWDPEGGSAMHRGDIAAQHFLRGLNWAYDALHEELTDAEREKLRGALLARAGQFWKALNPFRGTEENNHAWLQAYALAQSGLVLMGEVPEAADWAQYVLDLYVGRFLCCLGYQGDNNEGIGYWGYGLMFVIEYSDMMRKVCGIDLFRHPWLSQTARFPMYSAPPGAWAVSFADTAKPNHDVRGPAVTKQVGQLAERTGDPYALWYSGAREPVNGIMPRPPVDLPQSIWYRWIGWAVFNTSLVDGREGVTFAMRSGQFCAGHQHEDLNAFVINAYGEKLAIDGGYYDWYGSPHFKAYSTLTRAHNTLLVNGKDQGSRKKGADGRIAAYFDSPAYGYTVGDVSDPDVYEGMVKRFDRRAFFLKPGVVVIHDLLAATAGPARWDWLLHTLVEPKTDAEARTFAWTAGEATLAGRFLAPADLSLQVTKGFPVEPVDGYSTRPVPPERYYPEYHLTATPGKERQDEEILAAMTITRKGTAPGAISALPAKGGLAAHVAEGERTHVVLSRSADAKGTLSAAGIETDGDAACVTLGREGVLGAFAHGARFLRRQGKTLLATDAPADMALLTAPEGRLVTLNCPKAMQVTAICSRAPKAVLLDGKPARAARDAAQGVLTLAVPAGEHTVAFGADPRRAGSHSLGKVTVKIGATAQHLEGYARRGGDGLLRTWWGLVDVPAPDRYALAFTGAAPGAEPAMTCDGVPVEPGRKVWLTAGKHFLTASGRGDCRGFTFQGEGVKVGDARMLPKGSPLPAGALVVEAESVAAEGEVKAKVWEKVGASGGKAHCGWDTFGEWAEWEFEAPAAGQYTLLVKGAGEMEGVLRALLLDGKPLSPEAGVVRFAATGGWCRDTDDWRLFEVPGKVALAAGKHRLRMEHLGGSMNLDLFAWVK